MVGGGYYDENFFAAGKKVRRRRRNTATGGAVCEVRSTKVLALPLGAADKNRERTVTGHLFVLHQLSVKPLRGIFAVGAARTPF